MWFTNIFSHPAGCLFALSVPLLCRNFLPWCKSHLSVFCFVAHVSGVMSKKHLPQPMSCRIFPVVYSINLMVSNLKIRSLIHCDGFSYSVWVNGHVEIQSPKCIFKNILSFPRDIYLGFFFFSQRLVGCRCLG